jgi:hypothetical protein
MTQSLRNESERPERDCTHCGLTKPLDQFPKAREGGRARDPWHCDECFGIAITERTRRYRQDPKKAERDREASRRWKEQNRERRRAYDRAYRARKKAEQEKAA